MEKYVIGMDIGTSGLKSIVVNQTGQVVDSYSISYQTQHPHTGYSEIDPNIWYEATLDSLKHLMAKYDSNLISGISFSGQMHGLVVVNRKGDVIRPAILWNDTRTSDEVENIKTQLGLEFLLEHTQNTVLEGFTLPKLIWLKNHEPSHFENIYKFMLPKDYVIYKLTGHISTDPSDAAGTIMFNVKEESWSNAILEKLDIEPSICPEVIASHGKSGELTKEIMESIGIENSIHVYQGGADNACGALGAGITDDSMQLVSIGTSGVTLSIQNDEEYKNDGKVHYFNHCVPNQKYIMGVTLSAGYSLEWLKQLMAAEESFDEFLKDINQTKIGACGLIYTPYLLGERTPHNDADIRGSIVGLDAKTSLTDIKRAVLEGITFSLKDSIEIIKKEGKCISEIVSIGGGAKNKNWLQMQSDIFEAQVTTRTEEQGPAYGAAMLAAMGAQWFKDFDEISRAWIKYNDFVSYHNDDVNLYKDLYKIYKTVYFNTKQISKELVQFK